MVVTPLGAAGLPVPVESLYAGIVPLGKRNPQ